MLRRIGVVLLRVATLALLLALLTSILLTAYTHYEVHRAATLLSRVSRLQVGDREESVLAIVNHYGGTKWIPEPLAPKEQWIEPQEYDYQKLRLSDYNYEVTVAPFEMSRLPAKLQALYDFLSSIPPDRRAIFGLRDWDITVVLSIRDRKLLRVATFTRVEAHCTWLGHEWELSDLMPHGDMPRRRYLVGTAHMTILPNGGSAITNFFTPAASDEEKDIARSFNSACLTKLRGCNGFCEFAPRVLDYLTKNRDADWGIIPPKCY